MPFYYFIRFSDLGMAVNAERFGTVAWTPLERL